MPAFLADHPHSQVSTAIVDARIFDGESTIEETTLTIEGGRITAVGAAPERHHRVVEAGGRFLMPGLIDAHAHVSMIEHSSEAPKLAKGSEPVRPGTMAHLVGRNLRQALAMGVTTIRDVGAYGDVLFEARQAVRLGAFTSPRLLLSGRIVSATAPGGRFFPGMYREADGPDDIRRAVREQLREGADFVKIMSTGARSVELEDPNPSQVTAAEMEAFVDEAHRQGVRAAAHCEGLAGTRLAIEAGCDTIEHGFYLNQAPELLEAMARNGQILVPTLTFLHHVAESGAWVGVLEDQGIYNVEQARLTMAAAAEAGVTLALGSDSPDPDGAAHELGRMVEHGLGAAEALTAATIGSARALGLEGVIGRIAPGYLADLLLVDGDPIDDPTILSEPGSIWLVTRNGDPVAGAGLRAAI